MPRCSPINWWEYSLKARIQIVDIVKTTNEVPYSVIGRLNGFEFHRAWYYWIVFGRSVPFEIAKMLYEDPIGRTDIRVNGDCECPAPAGDVHSYHIDSIEGLRLFADTIQNLPSI